MSYARLLVLLALLVLAAVAPGTAMADAPKFKDYPADVYEGRTAAVQLDTREARRYRTNLRRGAEQPVNFAGHYILVTWGCGDQCQTGAVIDARSGQVTFLPHTVCCWDDGAQPFYYRADSRLLVMGGMLDEAESNGAHFFELRGIEFVRLPGASENAANQQPVASTNDTDESETVSADGPPPPRPDVANLLTNGYREVCPTKVDTINIELGRHDPPVSIIPDVGAYGEVDWIGYTDFSLAERPASVVCGYPAPGQKVPQVELLSSETACYLVDRTAICGPGAPAAVEPAAGSEDALMQCYGDGFDQAIDAVRAKSLTDVIFLSNILTLGGVRSIGDIVRRECNKRYELHVGRIDKSKDASNRQDLFMMYVALTEKKFLSDCIKKGNNKDYSRFSSLCRKLSRI